MTRVFDLVLLAMAGAAGTLLRAGFNAVVPRFCGTGFPWGTLAVNVLGSFAFGAIWSLARTRGSLSPAQETILLVGLLGGFTTYSSFAFQSVELAGAGRLGTALAYVAASNLLALAAAWAGLRVCGG